MPRFLKRLDSFDHNLIIVFLATSVLNFFSLLYQLVIAHALSADDFASFNSLLAIVMLIAGPLAHFQRAIVKYVAEFSALKADDKISYLLSGLFKITGALSVVSLFVFYFLSVYFVNKLHIEFISVSFILAGIFAVSWLAPISNGGIQGLELFRPMAVIYMASGAIKLGLAYILVKNGFNIVGAFAALFVSLVFEFLGGVFCLRKYVKLPARRAPGVKFNSVFMFVLPVAASFFCFNALISTDMILVKYFFSADESGRYALAQMLGKIFLFLPTAISLVLFPRAAGLKARNQDTGHALKKSFFYAVLLSLGAIIFYNLFPEFSLKVLTGKSNPDSVLLGRLFSISMSLYSLLFLMISYFLSVKDLRFIKYLAIGVLAQVLAIVAVPRELINVQYVLIINSLILLIICFSLGFKKKRPY